MRHWLAGLLCAHCLTPAAGAETRPPSHCHAIAEAARIIPAAARTPPAEGRVRISFVGHAMLLIETPDGLSAVTDYAGYLGSGDHVPDVATMNNAHRTHWTDTPDPRIPHVLRGWATGGQAAAHDLDLGGMRVRNVPTDVRSGGGVRPDGNSIFVFEAAGLCIGHLGHLHHEPDDAQYAAIGRLDVVMVPVDGGYTLDLPTMMRIVSRLRSSVVIPMHWFSDEALGIFLAGMADDFDVVETGLPSIEIGLNDLPGRPTILVLTPALLD
jgi:hypothetical protein